MIATVKNSSNNYFLLLLLWNIILQKSARRNCKAYVFLTHIRRGLEWNYGSPRSLNGARMNHIFGLNLELPFYSRCCSLKNTVFESRKCAFGDRRSSRRRGTLNELPQWASDRPTDRLLDAASILVFRHTDALRPTGLDGLLLLQQCCSSTVSIIGVWCVPRSTRNLFDVCIVDLCA